MISLLECTCCFKDCKQMKKRRNIQIPETHEQQYQVILKSDSNRQMVLYNPKDASVSIQRFEDSKLPVITHTSSQNAFVCPMCNRSFNIHHPSQYSSSRMHSSFMDTNYFRLLSNSSKHRHSLLQLEGSPNVNHDNEFRYINQECLNQGYYNRFFIEKERLGKGFRGSIFLCQHVLDDIQLGEYAIKKVPIGDRRDWLIRMLKEVHILERLEHPNIIHYKHAWIENHQLTIFGPEIPVLFILMELANGGNLEQYVLRGGRLKHEQPLSEISKRRLQNIRVQPLSSIEIISFISAVVKGLRHLHTHHILHRDLKPSNLLLRYTDPDDPTEIPLLSISDFGECETLYSKISEKRIERTGGTGTLEFMAPELIQVDSNKKFIGKHSYSSDIWSLGMIIYFIMFQHTFFPVLEDDDILRQQITGYDDLVSFPSRPDSLDPETFSFLTNIVRKCLMRNPDDRPSIHDISGQLELFLKTRNSYISTRHYSGMILDIKHRFSWNLSKHRIVLLLIVFLNLLLYFQVYEKRGCNVYGLILFILLDISIYPNLVYMSILLLGFILYYELLLYYP